MSKQAYKNTPLSIGSRHGRWTVVGEPIRLESQYAYFCQCDCGTRRTVRHLQLNNGKSQSCGCLARERSADRNRTHGMTLTRTFSSWDAMKDRCYRKGRSDSKIYHDRGITVCDRWLGKSGFQNFLDDMGERPDGMSLDRIDNDLGYSPSNCRWATAGEQANNKRSNRLIEYRGKSYTLAQLANIAGMGADTLEWRISRWNDVEKSVETKLKVQKNNRRANVSNRNK